MTTIRYILTGVLFSTALGLCAQRPNGPGGENMQRENGGQQSSNALLNASFWQAKPGTAAVKTEIEKGNNPAEMNSMSFDPVVMAINAGAPTESIKLLLDQKGNDPNKLTHDGRTYLFWAATRGNVEVMEYLLSKGAKVDLEDSHGMSVVNFAAGSGQINTAVYDLCLQHGANLKTQLTHEGANALLLSIGTDTTFKLTEYFQSKGLDLKSRDAAGNTAFDYAARSGNINMMKTLLGKGVKFSDNAILMAAQGSRRGSNPIQVYQYLESIGVKPGAINKNGENVLHSLVRRPGQTATIQYFLGKGVNVNQPDAEGNTAFMNAAATNRDTATLALLAPLVQDLNRQNKAGATALALAVRGNSPEAVQYLINKGAAVQTTDAKGNNLVYFLFESYSPRQAREFEPKLKLLQAAGLDIKAPQKDGNTLYHMAVAKQDMALLKLVQPFGVDVNAQNKEGLTALHKAAMISKDGSLMAYLVSIGARKDVKTKFDETAYDLAHENELLAKQNVSVDFLK